MRAQVVRGTTAAKSAFKAQVPWRRQPLLPAQAASGDGPAAGDVEEPETAKEAIDLGLALCKSAK